MNQISKEAKALIKNLETLVGEGRVVEFTGYIPEEESLEQALHWMSMVGIDSVVSEKWKYKSKSSRKVRVVVIVEDC